MESSRIQVIPAFAAKTSFNTPGAPEIFPKRAVEFADIAWDAVPADGPFHPLALTFALAG
jgi:hypothetical protein